MLSTSFEYRNKMAQNTKVLFKASMTFADGTTEDIDGDSVMMGSASFSDSVSSSGSFDVGAAIVNQFSVTLNNYDRRFDDHDFTDAVITPYVGVELESGAVEWLRKGVFGIEQPEAYGDTIGITALDNMRLLETPYSGVGTSYPATLRTIVQDICDACGVTFANPDFANGSFVVPERPDNDSLTCQSVLSYAAQASGNWARFDTWGRLRLDWYDTAAFESEDWLDGDRFDDDSPYSSGDTADGGNFEDYGSGAEADGGTFDTNAWEHVFALASATIMTDDVVITGVRVTAQDMRRDNEDDLEGETALYGSEGYVLDIPDNPLIQYGKAFEAAAQIGLRTVGMRFRPFDVSTLGKPWLEAGDPIVLTDRLQHQYTSYATTVSYKIGAYETIACSAESPGRNSASTYSAITSAIVRLRNSVKREKTARQTALATLADELANSSGLFMTESEQDDGSTIYYMHDKPTLAESQIVWKLTANAFGISTDGGRTYPYGLDVNGDAILNKIYAIGIDASYLHTGRISAQLGDNFIDLDTGDFYLTSANSSIDGQAIASEPYVDGATDKAIKGISTQEAIFNLLTNNGALKGLFMKDGQLYINATYIMGDSVAAKKLDIKDNDGNSILTVTSRNYIECRYRYSDPIVVAANNGWKGSDETLTDGSYKRLASFKTDQVDYYNGTALRVRALLYYWDGTMGAGTTKIDKTFNIPKGIENANGHFLLYSFSKNNLKFAIYLNVFAWDDAGFFGLVLLKVTGTEIAEIVILNDLVISYNGAGTSALISIDNGNTSIITDRNFESVLTSGRVYTGEWTISDGDKLRFENGLCTGVTGGQYGFSY